MKKYQFLYSATLNIRFNDESVELVDNHKHLGVTFVSDGNWTVHIENIAKSALKQVNVLRKLKFILSKQALSNIYQCSSLNADLSKIHIINNVKCNCGASFEDAIHYFLECPLYLNERRTLPSNCDDININIETLFFGNDK
jgi:hypothetical protein